MLLQPPTLPLPVLAIALGAALLFGCSEENLLFCDLRTPCEGSERSFCDIDRAYPGTTLENECITRPAEDACNRAQPCALPNASHCSGESAGVCVECTKHIHCDGSQLCDPRSFACTGAPITLCTPGASGDALCATEDPALPLCESGGVCVECETEDDCEGAVCDLASKTCAPSP